MNVIKSVFSNYRLKKQFNNIGDRVNEISPYLYSKVFLKTKSFLKAYFIKKCVMSSQIGEDCFFHWPVPKAYGDFSLKVSVIVPNYNHGNYLKKRLDSIYNQTYTNFEVILLDDCSNDNSRQILESYKKRYPAITQTIFNNINSGSVFLQWEKGLSIAKGDLIWIAESDDWCDLNFLEKQVPSFKNEMVMLSFGRSDFIESNEKIYSTEEYLSDCQGLPLSEDFSISAHDFVRNGMAVKNVIPNVSSALFRNVDCIVSEYIHEKWKQLRLCGDWLFYLERIRGGLVHYTPETTNYYRIHKKSTSLNIQATPQYYREHQIIAAYVASHYRVPFDLFNFLKSRLVEHWKSFNNSRDDICVEQLFDINYIEKCVCNRKPNIVMCGFSMTMGGGETYPIYLANEYKKLGCNITFADFELDRDDHRVRSLLSRDVPLMRMKSIEYSPIFIESLGADIIHTQHGMVDELVSDYITIGKYDKCKQIISLHGMYEATGVLDRQRLLNKVKKTCAQFIYTAEKNLESFKETNIIDWQSFIKIDNGLPWVDVHPISRSSIGVAEDSFVFCLVSRGIREKGWQEAADAIQLANKKSKKRLELLLIGDGIMYDALKSQKLDNVRLLGIKSNIRDYFAASDIGLLPSRFKGESYPLVVIDCLMAGRPVLATDVGEIRHQITNDDGDLAGILFPLIDGKVPVNVLAELMLDIANDKIKYSKLVNTVKTARKKFDMEKVSKKYLQIYNDTLKFE